MPPVKNFRKLGTHRSTRCAAPTFEALEQRLLLSAGLIPCIDLIEADNRGLVVMHVTQDLVAGTVDGGSVQLLGSGADGILGTDDDNVLDATVSYESASREIRIETTEIAADQEYGIRVLGDEIRATNGRFLDAEFNGAGVATGDGQEGGTLLIYTEAVEGNPIARIETNLGTIDIELFQDQTPLTVANFLTYANQGLYDRSFFHRLVADFVIQGGGFFAEEGFGQIPDEPPVQNEPGISNLRGTVAMAKIGGNPNSATNEWFFNLADNSANLDVQNGGFTVFAEITNAEGFDVLDLLTVGRDTIDASNLASAFGDLPVLDASQVTGDPTPDDLLRLTRVATLTGLTDMPFESLEVAAVTSATKIGAGVGVRLYALDEGTDADLAGMLDVRFGAGSAVESITIREGAATGRLAIEITGASAVRTLRDLRAGSSDIAFIVSSARISQVDLRGSVLGMDINDQVLPGGTQIANDLDGDGQFNDLVALYVPEGVVDSLRIRGDLTGDVIAPGGAVNVRVDGQVRGTELRFGGEALASDVFVNYRFNRVDQASLFTENTIRKLQATEWRNGSSDDWVVQAPAILDLKVSGGKGVDGDFSPSLTLTGPTTVLGTLAKARIKGNINNATWNIDGNVGKLRVDGDITQWEANINGALTSLRAERLQAVHLDVTAVDREIRAWSWAGGTLTAADGVRQLDLRGDRRTAVDGDLTGVDISINEDGSAGAAMDRFRIAGDMVDAEMLARSTFRSIEIGGELRDSLIQTAGDVGFVRAGESRDGELSINGLINSVTLGDWVGNLALGNANRVTIHGSFMGDLFTRGIERMTIMGDVESDDFRFNRAGQVRIQGDVRNTTVAFEGAPADTSVDTFQVDGAFRDSLFVADADVGLLMTAAMFDTEVYVGATTSSVPGGFPDENGSSIDVTATLDQLRVLGLDNGDFSFEQSIVTAGQMGLAVICSPDAFRFRADPFGLAAERFGSVFVKLDTGEVMTYQTPSRSPDPLGAFEIRVGFEAPGLES